MKVAIIGLGSRGKSYVGKVLQRGVLLKNVVGVDLDPAKVSRVKAAFPDMVFLTSMAERVILDHSDDAPDRVKVLVMKHVDAAIIATPASAYHQVVCDLLGYGVKKIYLQDGLDSSAAAEIRKALAEHGAELCGCLPQSFEVVPA